MVEECSVSGCLDMLDGEDGREGVRKGVSACSVQGVCDDWSRMRSK